MKPIRALMLMLVLSVGAYAGEIPNMRDGYIPNGKAGEIPCDKASTIAP